MGGSINYPNIRSYNGQQGSIKDLVLNSILKEIGGVKKPVIIVPDYEIHMLQWESLPVLKDQEVYRMPIVLSILYAYKRGHRFKVKDEHGVLSSPKIDPLDSYYLLNLAGDIPTIQALKRTFEALKLKGTSGTKASVEELIVVLQERNLYMYIGHGGSDMYMSVKKLVEVKECAAAFLMGCSSGSLRLNGSYAPNPGPLYYLVVGSPVVIGNLWDVPDTGAIDFTKALLRVWQDARSSSSRYTNECEVGCKHTKRIGCLIPCLMGAAPVCYGIPTGFRIQDEHQRKVLGLIKSLGVAF